MLEELLMRVVEVQFGKNFLSCTAGHRRCEKMKASDCIGFAGSQLCRLEKRR